jgi:hypothetical protein
MYDQITPGVERWRKKRREMEDMCQLKELFGGESAQMIGEPR